MGEVKLPNFGDELHHLVGMHAARRSVLMRLIHTSSDAIWLCLVSARRVFILLTQAEPAKTEDRQSDRTRGSFCARSIIRVRTRFTADRKLFTLARLALQMGEARVAFSCSIAKHSRFLGQWEMNRGPQFLHYDFWWHLGFDTLLSSEWGTPNMIENGLQPDLLLGGKYGHQMHVWDLRRRRHLQALDLGSEQQMVLEMRPAHDPTKAYGFVSVVVSLKDLSASVWLWHRNNGSWDVKKVIEISAEPADPAKLPAMLKDFKAVPPLVTDINLSLDDKFLYVSCWGTGEIQQYDVSDPFNPKKTGSVRIGGIVNRTPNPKDPSRPLAGGPQMVEVSRDGKRIYFTNSLYATWDEQFYPDGVGSWMVKLDAAPRGGMTLDKDFFVESNDYRVHQIRLEGGDSSSDSFCFP